MPEAQFSLSFPGLSSEQLLESLGAASAQSPVSADLSLEVRPAPLATRSIDPTVLVAVTNALSATLGIVITGLFQLAQSRRSAATAASAAPAPAPAAPATIVIVKSDGTRLELPVGVAQAEVDRAVEQAARLGVAHIYVSG